MVVFGWRSGVTALSLKPSLHRHLSTPPSRQPFGTVGHGERRTSIFKRREIGGEHIGMPGSKKPVVNGLSRGSAVGNRLRPQHGGTCHQHRYCKARQIFHIKIKCSEIMVLLLRPGRMQRQRYNKKQADIQNLCFFPLQAASKRSRLILLPVPQKTQVANPASQLVGERRPRFIRFISQTRSSLVPDAGASPPRDECVWAHVRQEA